jgi:hypothetical protein
MARLEDTEIGIIRKKFVLTDSPEARGTAWNIGAVLVLDYMVPVPGLVRVGEKWSGYKCLIIEVDGDIGPELVGLHVKDILAG